MVSPPRLAASLAVVSALAIAALAAPIAAQAKPGDLLVAEYGAASITRIDPADGDKSIVTNHPKLVSTSYVTFVADGRLVFSDEERPGLFALTLPGTNPRLIMDAGLIGPYGVSPDPSGNLILADFSAGKIFRVNLRTKKKRLLTSGDWIGSPYGAVADPRSGTIFVLDSGGAIERLKPNGDRTTLTSGPPLSTSLWGIGRAPDGTLIVGDSGVGSIFSVDPKTGDADFIANDVGSAAGVAVGIDGMVYVTDYGSGKISRVNPANGDVDPVTSVNQPVGITVEPPRCAGKLALIYGTDAGDILKGSRFGDAIAGLGAADTLAGFKGSDSVCGGPGGDTIKVRGGGRDRVRCGPGHDEVKADGRDRIAGDCEVVD